MIRIRINHYQMQQSLLQGQKGPYHFQESAAKIIIIS